jgi:hypothetical protein
LPRLEIFWLKKARQYREKKVKVFRYKPEVALGVAGG